MTTDFGSIQVIEGVVNDEAKAIALDPKGNIVVAGFTYDNNGALQEDFLDIAVARYLPGLP